MRSLPAPDRWGCMYADRGTRGVKTTMRVDTRDGKAEGRPGCRRPLAPHCWCARCNERRNITCPKAWTGSCVDLRRTESGRDTPPLFVKVIEETRAQAAMARNAERRTQEYFETLQQGAIATQTSLQNAVAVSVGAIHALMERDPRARGTEARRIGSGSSWETTSESDYSSRRGVRQAEGTGGR